MIFPPEAESPEFANCSPEKSSPLNLFGNFCQLRYISRKRIPLKLGQVKKKLAKFQKGNYSEIEGQEIWLGSLKAEIEFRELKLIPHLDWNCGISCLTTSIPLSKDSPSRWSGGFSTLTQFWCQRGFCLLKS